MDHSAAPIVKDKTFFYVDYEGQRENGAPVGNDLRARSGRSSPQAESLIAGMRRYREPGDRDQFAGPQSLAHAKHRRRSQ